MANHWVDIFDRDELAAPTIEVLICQYHFGKNLDPDTDTGPCLDLSSYGKFSHNILISHNTFKKLDAINLVFLFFWYGQFKGRNSIRSASSSGQGKTGNIFAL